MSSWVAPPVAGAVEDVDTAEDAAGVVAVVDGLLTRAFFGRAGGATVVVVPSIVGAACVVGVASAAIAADTGSTIDAMLAPTKTDSVTSRAQRNRFPMTSPPSRPDGTVGPQRRDWNRGSAEIS